MRMELKETKDDKNRRWFRWAVLALICANFFVWLAVADGAGDKIAEVWFFDVGQGDAAFVQLPGGEQIVIDGGPNAAVLEKLGEAMPFYDRDIDWVVLSHTDRDHLAGLLSVLKNYRVENIIWSGVSDGDAEDTEWERLIDDEGANVKIAVAGEKLELGGNPLTVLEILAPDENDKMSNKDQNELSVIVKLTYGEKSFLFCGDAKSKENGFIGTAALPQADVLKVSHHGSKYSTEDGFLAQVCPSAAAISCGKNNSYGHPHQEVLDLLQKYDITTLRTDQDGDIVFQTDGERIFVGTQK